MKIYGSGAAKAMKKKASDGHGELVVHELSGERALVVFPAYEADDGTVVQAYANVYRLEDLAREVTRIQDERSQKKSTWSP